MGVYLHGIEGYTPTYCPGVSSFIYGYPSVGLYI